MQTMLWWHWLILALPILPNFFALWHIRQRYFASEQEKSLWFLLSIFIPVLGGLIYLVFGLRRSKKEPFPNHQSS